MTWASREISASKLFAHVTGAKEKVERRTHYGITLVGTMRLATVLSAAQHRGQWPQRHRLQTVTLVALQPCCLRVTEPRSRMAWGEAKEQRAHGLVSLLHVRPCGIQPAKSK